MCESNVYLKQNGSETLIMENVAAITPAGENTFVLRGLLGEQQEVKAVIEDINLMGHKIILKSPLMKAFRHYLAAIARENGLAGSGNRAEPFDVEWIFFSGMLQDSPAKWWADFGTRMTCHEGVDICFYRPPHAPVVPLAPGAAVPAMFDGCILNITEDLLGQSVIIDLEEERHDPAQPVMVYAHLKALAGLGVGDRIRAGQLIGHTADTRIKGSRLLSHLHVSCIIGAGRSDPKALDWSLFTDRSRVMHLNPVFL